MHAVARQPLEDLEQREVGLGQGLEEPVFLEETLVFRMAHERQVRVQHEREIAFGLHPEITLKNIFEPPRRQGRQERHFFSSKNLALLASWRLHLSFRFTADTARPAEAAGA